MSFRKTRRTLRSRWTGRIAVLAALATAALALTSATAFAASSPPPAKAHSLSFPSFARSRADTCRPAAAASADSQQCAHWQKGVPSPAVRAQLRQLFHSHAARARSSSARSAQVSEPPGQCGFAFGTVVNNPDRLTSCSDTLWTLFTYVVDIFGNVTITGVLSFDDEQWTTYSTGAGNWDHGMQITAAGGQGDLAAGTTLDVSSTCDLASSACIAFSNTIPDPQSVAFVSGGPAEPFDWAEFDTGASASVPGQTNTLDATLGASIVANTPGYPPAAFTDSGNGLAGRCDSIVTSSDGCVNEQSIPTMNLSISVYGASAAMIQWAQENLSGHWGLQGQGQPLHRLFNSILQGDNRTIICQDGSFTADQNITNALTPYKDNDSCDEFPFASTYESGAMVDDVNSNQKP